MQNGAPYFLTFPRIRVLCSTHRSAANVAMRKLYSSEIKRLQRQEVRLWKHSRLRQSLRQPSHWKTFRSMVHTHAGQAYAPQPPLDDFADVLKTFFSVNKFFHARPATLTETPTKCLTKVGWQQKKFQHVPDNFCWNCFAFFTFSMAVCNIVHDVSEKKRAKPVTGFRPVANIVFFYKVFAYMILSRPEQSLESVLQKAQNGIRSGRTEEWRNMWTTVLFLDKRQTAGLPLWIITLDLSKAFDTINWEGLWEALHRQKKTNQFI